MTLTSSAGRSRSTWKFGASNSGDNVACLINSEGQALTPWLSIEAKTNFGDAFGDKLKAEAVINADGERCGWLLNFTEIRDGEDDPPSDLESASLLVVTSAQVNCFSTTASDSPTLALSTRSASQSTPLHYGLIQFPADGSGQIQIETGPEITLRTEFAPQGIAFGPAPAGSDATIVVFGILVPHRQLITPEGDARSFEPREYLPEPPPPPVAHPSTVIAEIRKNQTRMAARVDGLLDLLGGMNAPTSAAQEPMPEPFVDFLDDSQRAIWKLICADDGDKEEPERFSLTQLHARCQATQVHPGDDALAKTVELFIRIGLIVPVNLDGHNFYRRVLPADILSALPDGQGESR